MNVRVVAGPSQTYNDVARSTAFMLMGHTPELMPQLDRLREGFRNGKAGFVSGLYSQDRGKVHYRKGTGILYKCMFGEPELVIRADAALASKGITAEIVPPGVKSKERRVKVSRFWMVVFRAKPCA